MADRPLLADGEAVITASDGHVQGIASKLGDPEQLQGSAQRNAHFNTEPPVQPDVPVLIQPVVPVQPDVPVQLDVPVLIQPVVPADVLFIGA